LGRGVIPGWSFRFSTLPVPLGVVRQEARLKEVASRRRYFWVDFMVVVEFRSGGSLIDLDLFVMREGVSPAQSHLALGDDVNEGDQEEDRGAGQDCSGDIQSDQVGSVPDPVDLRVALEAGQIDSKCSEGPAEPPQEEAEKCTIGMRKTGEDLVHAAR
jgi:hypothetical protein